MKYAKWLLLLLWCQFSSAEETAPATGMDMLNHCRVYTQLAPMPWGFKMLDTNPSIEVCLSYMNGLIAPLDSGQESAAGNYCLPNDITGGQLAAVFVTYADQHPQSLQQEQDSAVSELIGKAFPCKDKH